MTERRPIEGEYHAGVADDDAVEEAAPAEDVKEVLSFHATGVTIVAVRDDANVYGTTVSSFAPVSVDPPLVLVSVGGNAQVLPFLDEGRRFVVNFLRGDQRRLATVYADSFPVGPPPFPEEGDPVIPDALAALRCRVHRVVPVNDVRLVLGLVVGTRVGGSEEALVHYRRDYHVLS